MKLIFEKSVAGRRASEIPASDVPDQSIDSLVPAALLRSGVDLPEVGEVDLVRHYVELSRRNFGVDLGFYPLGSCTMKYNPKINEATARYSGFTNVHPMADEVDAQGTIQLIYELQEDLKEITGMAGVTVQPAAGSHGELTGVMMMRAYFEQRGEKRTKIIIPDAAHGTNPASAALAGFECIELRSNAEGGVDLDHLKELMQEDVAGLMLTNPNTLGLFERNIEQVLDIVHSRGGLSYCDGANMNALVGVARPGDMGFDVIHLNIHKTFSTPHGGGGPGCGPVGVSKRLIAYLPEPIAAFDKTSDSYQWAKGSPESIGRVSSFYGNVGIMIRAYTYIRMHGPEGLRRNTHYAVLNANYIMHALKDTFERPIDRVCMHECVLSSDKQVRESGVHTLDIAKRLLDYGIHPPTIYFPMIVSECLMIEPTETESMETLDNFIEVMKKIAEEANTLPDLVKTAPHKMVVGRLDNVAAARTPNLCYCS